jgi:hypothetical protein
VVKRVICQLFVSFIAESVDVGSREYDTGCEWVVEDVRFNSALYRLGDLQEILIDHDVDSIGFVSKILTNEVSMNSKHDESFDRK